MSAQIKSKKRVTDHGEVFTSPREVNAMLDLVKDETERIDAKFLEPACGTGNFLVEILKRKLAVVNRMYAKNQAAFERYGFLAVANIYGIELLQDNVIECQKRLLTIFKENYLTHYKQASKPHYFDIIQFVLEKNILLGDALSYKIPNSHKYIVFTEWSFISDRKVQRTEYTFKYLVDKSQQMEIFSAENNDAYIPEPTNTFPPIDYFNLLLTNQTDE